MIQYFPVVTGSLTVSGSVNISGGITASGGISISGSIASASFATTASFVALAQSASNAVSAATASFANTLTVAGNLTAQTLVVQTITSSVDFVTGSTRFGSISANTHQFTGSVLVSGSITSQGGFILGNSATIAPTGSIGYNNAVGVFIYGKSGSEADFRLYNRDGLTAMSVTAGTQNVSFNGTATFSSALSTGDTLTAAKTKGGSGVESLSLLDLKLLGASAIGDNININFLNNSINIARISGVLGGDNVAYGSLAFSTRNYFTDSMVEVMRINNRGNMLVGTTTDSGYKLDISGTTRVNGSLLTNTIRTTEGSTTANSGAYATLFTISGSKAVFQIFVQVPAGAGDAANYTVYAVVLYDGSAARIIANNGGVTDIILSGLNVQARQQSGNPQTIEWKYLRIQ
jgi:phage baseplate assembly protein gpV